MRRDVSSCFAATGDVLEPVAKIFLYANPLRVEVMHDKKNDTCTYHTRNKSVSLG